MVHVIDRIRGVASDRMHLALMLILTFSTGIIDAVGYLGLDRVFTGNMTGNVVILGMGLMGADGLPVLGPVVALGGFMAGAAVAGRALHGRAGWSSRSTALLGVVGGVMAALALTVLLVPELPHVLAVSVTCVLGAVMGLQAAVARVIAVKDVTTVVVTSTITGLAADSVLGSGAARAAGGGSGRRFLAVVLILAGAGAGALLLRIDLAAGLAASAFVTLAVAAVGAVHERHHR